jgi:hypothetical protein
MAEDKRYCSHFVTSQKNKSAKNSNVSGESMQNSTVARSKNVKDQ